MGMGSESEKRRKIHIFTVCLIGIVLNMIGSEIVILLKLPIYLDTVGTLIVSVMSGYLPGIIVGLTTNILKTIQDTTSIYYAFINVLVAVIASHFAMRGKVKKPLGAILMTVIIALVGGLHEGILTWVRGEYTSDMSVVKTIFGFIVNDFIDKAVSVVMLELILIFIREQPFFSLIKSGVILLSEIPLFIASPVNPAINPRATLLIPS